MKRFILLFIVVVILFAGCMEKQPRAINAIIFTKTNGYRHASIEAGMKMFNKISRQTGMKYIHSEDSSVFDTEIADSIDVLVFFNTSGEILNQKQQQNIEAFIKNGGGFLGIHSASATEYNWPWYGKLVGAFFSEHPPIQKACISLTSEKHACTNHMPDTMTVEDEWYNYRSPLPDHLRVLITVDETTYDGGKLGDYHPVSWYHEFDGGRSFYTSMGHLPEMYGNDFFIGHITCGLVWASGRLKRE